MVTPSSGYKQIQKLWKIFTIFPNTKRLQPLFPKIFLKCKWQSYQHTQKFPVANRYGWDNIHIKSFIHYRKSQQCNVWGEKKEKRKISHKITTFQPWTFLNGCLFTEDESKKKKTPHKDPSKAKEPSLEDPYLHGCQFINTRGGSQPASLSE